MLLAQLSDFHIGVGYGSDRDAIKAIRAVAALEPVPDATVVSGDLTEHGMPEEYEQVRALLGALPMPVHVMVGNHDDRAALQEAFPRDDVAVGERYRYAVACGGLRLVACDTTIPGEGRGTLAEDLPWLEERLAEDTATPTIVAMHHPPLHTGMPVFEEIGIAPAEQAALGELLERFPQVLRVITGHIHMASWSVVGRCPVASAPTTWRLRARLKLGAEGFEVSEEPAGFALHAFTGGRLVTHVQPL